MLFEIAPKIERLEGATEARESVLSQSLRYLDSLAGEARDDRALQSELAAAYEKIGDLQGNPTNPNLVALSDALTSYGKANAIRRALLCTRTEDREQRRQLADNYRALGDIHYQTNEPTASQRDSEAALAIYSELLAAQNRTSQPLRRAQARTIHDLGLCLSTNGKKAESMAYFRRTLALGEALRKTAPNDVGGERAARGWSPAARERPLVGIEAAGGRDGDGGGRCGFTSASWPNTRTISSSAPVFTRPT